MIRLLQILIMVVLVPVSLAQAQTRDVYTVRGIAVDQTAATVIEAQQAAFAEAKVAGAWKMINRITLPEDRAGASELIIDLATAERLAVAVDVEEETRGAGRYRGRLAVVFNPNMVRAFLDGYDIPYIDQQAALAVTIPVSSLALEYDWNTAWPDRSQEALAPTVASRSFGYEANADWDALGPEAALYGARRAVIAQLLGAAGSYSVDVTVVTASGRQPLGTTRRVATLKEAVIATNALLDQTWKQSSVIRDKTRTLVEATVLYTSLAEWNTLRGALARSPLVSEFQTKAVARDGAVVAFVFAGDGQRLISDLRDRGVTISAEDIGYVLTSAVTSARAFSE